jgi:hypothetical protein
VVRRLWHKRIYFTAILVFKSFRKLGLEIYILFLAANLPFGSFIIKITEVIMKLIKQTIPFLFTLIFVACQCNNIVCETGPPDLNIQLVDSTGVDLMLIFAYPKLDVQFLIYVLYQ